MRIIQCLHPLLLQAKFRHPYCFLWHIQMLSFSYGVLVCQIMSIIILLTGINIKCLYGQIPQTVVPASMIGYTQGSEGRTPSRCQEKGGDFRTLEKILPDLDSGACGIIIHTSAWTYLSAQAFVHLIRSSGCSLSYRSRI